MNDLIFNFIPYYCNKMISYLKIDSDKFLLENWRFYSAYVLYPQILSLEPWRNALLSIIWQFIIFKLEGNRIHASATAVSSNAAIPFIEESVKE